MTPSSWTEMSLLRGDGIRTSSTPGWSVLRVTWLAGIRQPSQPQATSPTPKIPSPLEFHCKAKSGGWKRRGALRWLWENLPPRLYPPGGLAPTTTTRLFSAPELRMLSSLEMRRRLAFEWCGGIKGCRPPYPPPPPPSFSVEVDEYLSTALTPRTLCPSAGAVSDLLLGGGPGEILSNCFMGS
ncbi:G1/S-specific cyclin-D2 isoform X5 [Mus musculus]|nr:G1/S-specific cyclin-D2 isoform X5 [Mus musculus]